MQNQTLKILTTAKYNFASMFQFHYWEIRGRKMIAELDNNFKENYERWRR